MLETVLEIKTPDGCADGYLYRPDAPGIHQGVVMLTDVIGMRDDFRRMAGRLADRGFVVLLPNMYYRSGRPPFFDHVASVSDPNDVAVLNRLKVGFDAGAMARDGGAYAQFLAQQPFVHGGIGFIGHCSTGPMVLRAAAAHPELIVAGTIYHGSRMVTDAPDSPHLVLPQVKARLYCAHAREDRSMPADKIAIFEAALRKAQCMCESETVDALHGFAIDGHRNFDPQVAAVCWTKMTTLFRNAL